MSRRPLVALIVDSRESRTIGRMESDIWDAALATVRAVFERGGRVLLSASAEFRLPLLMAAAEYVTPTLLETGDEPAEAPVILGPFPPADSFEDDLFYAEEERQDEGGRASLLTRFSLLGLLEEPAEIDLLQGESRKSFSGVLHQYRPRAVCRVGDGERLRSLVDVAEGFRQENPEVRLLDLLGTEEEEGREWRSITSWLERIRAIPSHIEGTLGERWGEEGRLEEDERLGDLIRRAGQRASLALAIDQAIADVFGEE